MWEHLFTHSKEFRSADDYRFSPCQDRRYFEATKSNLYRSRIDFFPDKQITLKNFFFNILSNHKSFNLEKLKKKKTALLKLKIEYEN